VDRIFTISHVTQLMVILHLRRHLGLPKAREFLIWNPLVESSPMDLFMQQLIPAAGFTATLDMRRFDGIRPRTQGPLSWWFESARRLRNDARAVRAWLQEHQIDETDAELWSDDPIHFNGIFLKGLLRRARQVKFPHAFNLEDSSTPQVRDQLVADLRGASKARKYLFAPWQGWVSGVDTGPGSRLNFAEGYTFDQPSCWAPRSIDASHLISVDAFRETYECLPRSVKAETEAMLAPIAREGKPVILLLLFGFGNIASSGILYQNTLSRVFREKRAVFSQGTLVVKTHPGTWGDAEDLFFRWLDDASPTKYFCVRGPLNLEFLLHKMNLAYVLAGPCGALPIVKRLRTGRPIVLPEILSAHQFAYPQYRSVAEEMVAGMEIW
jgi:hypothetical protein